MTLSVTTLVIMTQSNSVFFLNVVVLGVSIMTVNVLSVFMLTFDMLSVFMLSIIRSGIVAPLDYK
jgi:hypothetical protein